MVKINLINFRSAFKIILIITILLLIIYFIIYVIEFRLNNNINNLEKFNNINENIVNNDINDINGNRLDRVEYPRDENIIMDYPNTDFDNEEDLELLEIKDKINNENYDISRDKFNNLFVDYNQYYFEKIQKPRMYLTDPKVDSYNSVKINKYAGLYDIGLIDLDNKDKEISKNTENN